MARPPLSATDLVTRRRDHICLYASFDSGIDADFSRGDGRATAHPDVVGHAPSGGRFGGALAFSAAQHGWDGDEFTGQQFEGGMDEFLILDRALSAQQIAALHGLNAPLGVVLQ